MSKARILLPIARILLKKWPRAVLLIVSVALGVGTVALVLALGEDLRSVLLGRLFRDFPVKRIDVYPKSVELLGLKLSSPGPGLSRETADALADLPDVEEVSTEVLLPVPVCVVAEFVPEAAEVQCSVYGVDAGVVETDKKLPEFRFDPDKDVVPAVVSRSVLEGYNTGFAPSQGFPRLTESILIGKKVVITIGASMFTTSSVRQMSMTCRIIAVSDAAALAGISVPKEYVRRWYRWWMQDEEAEPPINRLIVTVRDAARVDAVCGRIVEMGLLPAARRQEGKRLAQAAKFIRLFQLVIAAAVLGSVSLVLGAQIGISVGEKRAWYGLFQAIGAGPAAVSAMILFEGIMHSALGGALGIACAAHLRNRLAAEVLAQLDPLESWTVAFPTRVFVFAAILSVALGIAACVPSLLRVAFVAPARNMNG